jgi:DNA-binding SARP family transcriptional activator
MGKATWLEIRLFGSPKILLNDEAVEGIRRKNGALLFYLAGRVERLSRDHLLNPFWPDHDRATAQPILRTMIHDLRRQLGQKACGSRFVPGRRICIQARRAARGNCVL